MSAVYGKYNMLADVYQQTTRRAPSGQAIREWDYNNPVMTIKCVVRGPGSEGLRNVGSSQQFSGSTFSDIEWVRVRYNPQPGDLVVIDKSFRVGNIRTVDRWGDVTQHWVESDGSPERFDVLGVAAIQDPFGRLIEYEVLGEKVQP